MVSGVGAGYLKRPENLGDQFPMSFGVLAFLRHSVRLAAADTEERDVTLHIFLIDSSGAVSELDPTNRSLLTRALYEAVRVRDPEITELASSLADREQTLAARLRAVTDDERAQGVRPAVWPIAALMVC
jgi:hypothetical protein